MKKLLLFLFFAFFALSWQVDAQVTIGTETATDQGLPIEPYFGYSYSQVIYLQSEIGASGDITTLTWDFAGNSISSSNDWTVYIGHTTKTEFASVSDWVDVSTLTQVFSGTVTVDANDKVVVDITDFTYNNTDNLIIAVDENASGYNGSGDDFYCSSVSSFRGLEFHSDSNNPDPTSPPDGNLKGYIANIVLGGIAQSCPAPSDLTVTNETTSGADLGWTENGSSIHWDLEIGTTGFTPTGTPTDDDVTTNPYTWSGGNAATTYDYYVRADCGADNSDVSGWVGPYTFTTLCNAFTATYSENFDAVSTPDLPLCWSKIVDATSTYAAVETTTTNNSAPNGARLYNSSDNAATLLLITPEFSDLTSQANQIRFYARGNGYDLIIGTMSDPSDQSTFTSFTTLTLTSSFEEYTVSFSTYTGSDTYIAFKHGLGGTYRTIYIDDFNYEPIPACPSPSSQAESNMTATTVDLSWQENGTASSWDIELGTTGFSPTGTPTQSGVTNPYTYGGLTANTTYDWYVRADCGGGSYSNWVGPHTFTLVPPPANDDCDGAYMLTVNSDLNCGSTTNGTVEGATQSPEDASACGGTEDDDVWFKFVATATEHKIELLNAAGSTTDLYHSVWEGTCPGGLTLVSGTCSDPNSQTVSGLTIGNTYFIRVYTWTSTGGQNTTFDVCVGTPPQPPANDDCSGAIALTVGNPGDCPTNQVTTDATSATADGNTSCDNSGENIGVWYSFVAPATGEVVVNYTAGTATGNPGITIFDACGGAEVAGTCQDNPATLSNITGLTGGTTYYMLLWFDGASAAGSFDICLEDVGACPKPSGQTESNITATSADLDWTENGTATTWDIELGANGFAPTGTPTKMGVTKPYKYDNLTANTSYDWYVRADCGAGSQSVWEGPHTFTTSPPPPANDMLCNAIALTVDAAPATYTNTSSTGETGEPNGSCWYGTTTMESVWFSFVAPNTGSVEVTTDFDTPLNDTHIAIYEVGDCNDMATLTEKGCDEDSGDAGQYGWNSIAQVYGLTAGNTYYVQVDGYNDKDGEFQIQIKKICPNNLVVLPAASTSTTSTASCIDGDWTHFYDGTNILLSLKLGSSGAVITDVTVDPDGATDAQWFANDADGFPSVAGETGAAFMKRKWNVNASTQPSSDVGVRFYYTDDEFDAVNTVLTNNGGTALTGKNGMDFYKVTSGEDPFNISPGGIAQGDYELIQHGAAAGINTWVDGTFGTENYAEFNVAGFSGGGAGSGSAGKSIPIELLSFTGYADKDANVLNWSTLSEINTSMFYVERSEIGKEWDVVAKVEASGNSLSKRDYQVKDKEPVTKAFYRLRSVDRDGKYTISRVITIERKETGLRLNAVYPNPNNGNFVVNLTSLPGEKGQIVLINALGIKVYTKELNTKGGRTIEKINVNQLPNGVYTLMLEQNSDIITKRIVISK